MNFFVISAACVAVVAAQYDSPPAPAPYPGNDSPGYPAPAPGPYPPSYPPQYPYPYPDDKDDFKKLRDLKGEGIVRARIRYFKHKDDDFAVISCPKSSNPTAYTWILANSDENIPSFSLTDTVALTGGVNVEYVAKLGERGRWEGDDFWSDDRQKFRRVGCFHGTTQSGLPN